MSDECMHPDDLAEWQRRRAAVEAAQAALERYAHHLSRAYRLQPGDVLYPDGVIERGGAAPQE